MAKFVRSVFIAIEGLYDEYLKNHKEANHEQQSEQQESNEIEQYTYNSLKKWQRTLLECTGAIRSDNRGNTRDSE